MLRVVAGGLEREILKSDSALNRSMQHHLASKPRQDTVIHANDEVRLDTGERTERGDGGEQAVST